MPVTFKKKEVVATKSQAKRIQVQTTEKEKSLAALAALVDPLYEQLMEAKALKGKLAKLEAKIKPEKIALIEAFNEVYGKDIALTVEGKEHAIKVAAASKVRKLVKIDECFDMLEGVKEGLFSELAKVSMGDLDSYLNPDQLDDIIETEQNPMTRSITPVVE